MASNSESYEMKMEKLAQIVKKLEHGELSLEENLKSYEEGMNLYKELKIILEEKEGVIRKLLFDSGETEVFENVEEEEDDFS
ncbi:exodeoxyribonuclease VII, small subunit [Peptostreptococcaceae bacterium oral taxon 113 str. W5053]|nr:exodeoxyribonuclease VII, small subunit [Peptostreptococcaceae bacterium oral taxon 113 str. W5053]